MPVVTTTYGKLCPHCNQVKKYEEFYLTKRGYSGWCKVCERERSKAAYSNKHGSGENILYNNRRGRIVDKA